jgi:hypothetical protein
MADVKKRGFHALEERIHQMEEEDRTREKTAAPEQQEMPRTQPPQDREMPRKK